MSVIINDYAIKPFCMEKGLRQGDPLSPFLFVIVAKVLNRLSAKAADSGLIEGLQIGCERVYIFHLQFTDDTILFCPPRYETIVNYTHILDCFSVMSGLRVNYEKSVLVPILCDDAWVSDMKRVLEFMVVPLPIKYLGIPPGANPNRLDTWKPVLDKIWMRLSGWKANVLSKAGRIVLIKSVLNNLPISYLSLFRMPKLGAKEIISIQQRFFWGKTKGERFHPLVKWEIN